MNKLYAYFNNNVFLHAIIALRPECSNYLFASRHLLPVGQAAKLALRPDGVFCLKATQGAKTARQKNAKIALPLRAGIARDSLTTLLNDLKQLLKIYIHFSLLIKLPLQLMSMIDLG